MKLSKVGSYIIALFILVITFAVGRCSVGQQDERYNATNLSEANTEVHDHKHSILSEGATTWSCSMHPQIQQSEAGQCPICGMDLIPINTHEEGGGQARILTMSESAIALADIQTSHVEKRFPAASVRLVGKLDYDETRVRSLSARFPARIDRLYINFNGLKVQRGEHLAKVFSPELLTAVSELLRAHRYAPNSDATQAAKEKLRRWDLLPAQIAEILKSNTTQEEYELLAPISGVVVQKNINEGDYVKAGQPLFKIVDLSHLWLRLEAYESDLALLRFGQGVSFSVEAFPGEVFEGHISFVEPEINRQTRTVAVRVNVPNAQGRLKPGMFAKATVSAKIAKQGVVYTPDLVGKWVSPMHPQIIKDGPGTCDICGMALVPVEKMGITADVETDAPIIVPSSAVLRTGKRAVVYLRLAGDTPQFEGREIRLGARAGDYYIVKSGLAAGDEVVTNGAFKIDSAMQIKAQPSMMNPENLHDEATLTLNIKGAQQLLPHYLAMQSALASDDFDGVIGAVKKMLTYTQKQDLTQSALRHLLQIMHGKETLDAVRRPHFEKLSKAFIDSIEEHPKAFGQSLYQMVCPMVYDTRGASWLQADKVLRNPYFGHKMLTCGELQSEYPAKHSPNFLKDEENHQHLEGAN